MIFILILWIWVRLKESMTRNSLKCDEGDCLNPSGVIQIARGIALGVRVMWFISPERA
jgi:hypothetical protein